MKKLLYQKFALMLLLISISASITIAQVSGIVTSTDDGSPLIGANVVVKGTSTGAITDIEGKYQVEASQGDVLMFSYTGFLAQEITVESSANIDVQLGEDATTLNDVVVTATRQPIRKIQTTTAINTIGSKAIALQQPESFAEAITYVPGVTVENSQGRKSSFNIRGFPSGNTYVTTLLDGLPLSGFASRSAGTTEFIGLDRGVERIEVVRGSGATLFGRAAAAGAVNIITRTGGDQIGGMVSVTRFNNVVGDSHRFSGDFDYRADFNLNGPIADNLKFNVSGYIMNDSGYKEWAIKDQGAQISGNLDYEFNNKSTIRIYGMYGNNQFNNLTDSPYNIGTGELADGWENFNTFYPDNRQLDFNSTLRTSVFAPLQFTSPILDVNGNEIIQNQADRNREEVIGGYVGLSANFNLGNDWSIGTKLRVQSFDWKDHNEITFSSFYTAESNILRLNANSTGAINDIIGEARISKLITTDNAKHNLSAGVYFSDAEYDRFGGLHWYTSNVNPAPTYSWFGPPGTPPLTRFSLSTTTSHQEEDVFSFFIGDEMTFNDKLTINAGLRYDKMTGFFNNDPDEVDGIDYNPAEVQSNELDFSDWSWSLGVNYLLKDRAAVYASYLRAFSLPSVGLSTGVPDKNEIVNNIEVGYRVGVGDLGIDIGLFNTVIDNRLASVFDPGPNGQTFVTRPVGTNKVRGAELELTYAPSAVKGLLFRGTFTLQRSEFDGLQIFLDKIDHDGDDSTPMIPEADIDNLFGLNLVTLDAANNDFAIDVTDNQVHNTPKSIFTFNTSYTSKYFGLGFDIAHYAGRFAGALNLVETPDLTVANANIFGQIEINGNNLRLGLRIKNLFNGANPQQFVLGSANDTVLVQKQQTPNFNNTLGFGISQIPRRVLLTLSYDF